MTDLEKLLAEIRERLAKATPGPWRASPTRAMGEVWAQFYAGDKPLLQMRTDFMDTPDISPDETLIAYAPTDLERLLRIVDVQREALMSLKTKLTWQKDTIEVCPAADAALDEAERIARGES